MAGAAVHIDRTGCGRIGTFACVTVIGCHGTGIDMVLVLVVAHVLRRRSGATLMLAISGHCSPTELHRQKKYQKDEEPATHCGQSVAAGFW